MKNLIFIAVVISFTMGCAAHNQSLIDSAAKDMKFKAKTDISNENHLAIDKKCREQIEEPYYKTGIWLGAVGYIVKMQYAYQDCMAENGFVCIENCAYKPK